MQVEVRAQPTKPLVPVTAYDKAARYIRYLCAALVILKNLVYQFRSELAN